MKRTVSALALVIALCACAPSTPAPEASAPVILGKSHGGGGWIDPLHQLHQQVH
jgi:hypothetical protein